MSGTPKGEHEVRVEEASRQGKKVTMVRGMECNVDDRKAILKKLKGLVGGGGTYDAATGIIEIQGSHADRVVTYLKEKEGFKRTKRSGK